MTKPLGKKKKKKKKPRRSKGAGSGVRRDNRAHRVDAHGPRRPALSLCVIARNEAAFLEECLGSARQLADDIVVVDTGSTDDTRDVALRHGARVSSFAWRGDFSAARNESLAQARGEWILILDCDEVIATPDGAAIAKLIASGEADAYRLTTRNYIDEPDRAEWRQCDGSYSEERSYRGWFPSTKVRLWRNDPAIRFEGAVHELVEHSLNRHGAIIEDCAVPVHHYGYGGAKTRPDEAYVEAGERKVRDRPSDLQARYELAIAYRNAGRFERALEAIEGVVVGLGEADSGTSYPYLEEELVHLVRGDILDRLTRLEEALQAYRWVADRFPRSYQAYNNMGSVLGRQGDIAAAADCYRRGLRCAPDNQVLAANLAKMESALERGLGGVQWGDDAAAVHSLSCCLIVKDGGEALERCLASVAAIADEIVVVDTGSKDDSIRVAETYGARIGSFAWIDDFAAARNASLELATGDWILWMDADDYLLPADAGKVERAKRLKPDRGLYATLVNEGGEDLSRFRQIKMFPNLPEIRFERPVHETVVPSLERLGLPIVPTDAEVRHTGYADKSEKMRKQRYYLSLMLKWLEDVPDDFDICFRVGHTYHSEGRKREAAAYFDRIVETGQDSVNSASVFRLATTFKGRMALEDGRPEEALGDLRVALRMSPEDVLANMSIGDALTKTGDFEAAIPHLQKAREGQPDPYFPVEPSLIRYSAHFFLGQCYEATGRYLEAAEAFEAAHEACPQRHEAKTALSQLRLSAGTPTDAGAPGDAPAQRKTGLYKQTAAVMPTDMTATERESRGEETNSSERLTLCMIVRDEEARLRKCLESVKGLCDELVVDTGSTDRTIEIAESFGAVIGNFEWCDDFAAARNESLRLATGDWIVWLDADDLLPARYHATIRTLLGRGRDKAYFFALDDQGYESVSCLQMRLFPNLSGVRFEMPIHEQVTISLAELGVEMVPTDIKVVHTGYTTPEVVREKKDRYLAIMEAWLLDHPESYMVRSHVALTYHSTGRYEEALESYRSIVEDSSCLGDRNWVVYTTALLFLGRTYLRMGEPDKARPYLHKAEDVDPDYVLTRLSLAETYVELEDWERVLEYAESVVQADEQITFFPVDQRELTFSSLWLSGRAHQALGEFEKAEGRFRDASKVPLPRRSEALGSLSDLHKARGDADGARRVLEEAHGIDPQNPKHIFNLGMLDLEKAELEEAADRFREVLQITPDYGPALLNLGFIAKTRSEFDEAEHLYKRLVQVDPKGTEAQANLGHLFLSLERYDEAIEQFEAVRKGEPNLLDINLGLLFARTASDVWDQALAVDILAPFGDGSSAISSKPEAVVALAELGALLAEQDQPKCAVLAFEIVVAAGTGEGADSILTAAALTSRRYLGELLFDQGDVWRAIPHYEALLMADPQDGELFRQLGDCYAKLGVNEAARMCYDKSGEAPSATSA